MQIVYIFYLIRRCHERRRPNERVSLDKNSLPLYTTDIVKLSHNWRELVSRLPCREIVEITVDEFGSSPR